MRFLAFLDDTTGVRGFVVSNREGELLADMGTGTKLRWSAAHVAAVAQELAVTGALAGLGDMASAAVRGSQSTRLLTRGRDGVALLDLEPARATADLESLLRTTEWLSDPVPQPSNPEASQHDTLPPRPPSRAPRSRSVPATATQPPGLGTAVAVVTSARAGAVATRPPAPRRPPVPSRAADPSSRQPGSGSTLPIPKSPPLPPRRSRAEASTAAALATALVMEPPGPALRDLAPEVSAAKPAPPQPGEEVFAKRAESSDVRVSSPLLTGSLGTFPLPDLLEFLRVGQRTGTLVCAANGGLGAIHLNGGRITGAMSPGVPGIGDWLVERGAISRSQLHEALRHQATSDASAPLGTTLMTKQFVSREVLQEALSVHVASVLRKLMSWESGEFTFDPAVDREASALALGVEVDPQAVLLDIFKDMDHSRRA